MITRNGKDLRNLEETVQWCTANIKNIYETSEILGKLGIKVVDQVATPDLLPNRETYTGDYGDAILVGEQAPYDYYIWTRPFPGEQYGEWFDIGEFPLPGPKGDTGDTGPEGPAGERGNKWFLGEGRPTGDFSGQAKEGDFFLDTLTNNYFQYTNSSWNEIGTLRGLQGAQGPRGPKGDTAAAIEIQGLLSNINQLPDPTTAPRYAGYIVTVSGVKHLYGITGDPDNLTWSDFGEFNAGSLITTNNVPQATWDTTNAVPSIAGTFPGEPMLYGTDDGYPPEDPAVDTTFTMDTYLHQARPYSIARYIENTNGTYAPTNNGRILQKDPELPYQVANKNYVDTLDSGNVKKFTDGSGFFRAFVQNTSGDVTATIIASSPTAIQNSRLAVYLGSNDGSSEPGGNGRLLQKDPVQPYQVANKNYVDTKTAALYNHRIQIVIDNIEFNFSFNSPSNESFVTNWSTADKAAVAARIANACGHGTPLVRETPGIGSAIVFCTASGSGTITYKNGISASDPTASINIANASSVIHDITTL